MKLLGDNKKTLFFNNRLTWALVGVPHQHGPNHIFLRV